MTRQVLSSPARALPLPAHQRWLSFFTVKIGDWRVNITKYIRIWKQWKHWKRLLCWLELCVWCVYDCPSVLSVPTLPGARTVTKGAWPCQAAFKPHHDQHGSQQAGGQDIYTVYISLNHFVCAQFSLSSWIWHWRRSSPHDLPKLALKGMVIQSYC